MDKDLAIGTIWMNQSIDEFKDEFNQMEDLKTSKLDLIRASYFRTHKIKRGTQNEKGISESYSQSR